MKTLSLFVMLFLGSFIYNTAHAQSIADKENEVAVEAEISPKNRVFTKVANDYVRYLNDKNLEGILSLYADNASLEDPVGSKPLIGKEELRKFYIKAEAVPTKVKRSGPIRVNGNTMTFSCHSILEEHGVELVTGIQDIIVLDQTGKIVSVRAIWGPTSTPKGKQSFKIRQY